MATPKIEEILGFNTAKGKDSESVTRRFYVTADTPETAKIVFENFAAGLFVPNGLELSNVDLDEEKNGNGVYFGTITFSSPNQKIKSKISNDLFEVYGEKMSEGQRTVHRHAITADSTFSETSAYSVVKFLNELHHITGYIIMSGRGRAVSKD
ncbi:MAG: hypothetical protein LBU65_17050 [Planctomycetaceae bacterium]|jgi:hypothetical protein|nr:hypothetical protein [Planctomycetaceae bacterium]